MILEVWSVNDNRTSISKWILLIILKYCTKVQSKTRVKVKKTKGWQAENTGNTARMHQTFFSTVPTQTVTPYK